MEKWRFINSVSLDSDGKFDISTDHNENPFAVNEVLIHCNIQSVAGTNFHILLKDCDDTVSGTNLVGFMSPTTFKEFCVHVKYEENENGGTIRFVETSGYNKNDNNTITTSNSSSVKIENLFQKIARIYTDVDLTSGSEIDIWGR